MSDERTAILNMTRSEAETLKSIVPRLLARSARRPTSREAADLVSLFKKARLVLFNLTEPEHDWVEVIPHQHAGSDERHFICARCNEFKIKKAA